MLDDSGNNFACKLYSAYLSPEKMCRDPSGGGLEARGCGDKEEAAGSRSRSGASGADVVRRFENSPSLRRASRGLAGLRRSCAGGIQA